MPELPEVEMITGVIRRHAQMRAIEAVEVLRQPKSNSFLPKIAEEPITGARIWDVYRVGKRIIIELDDDRMVDCHNAMTGYWDWEHEPWNFDYVEGPRKTEDDVRVRFMLEGGLVLRYHDARMFGHLTVTTERRVSGPELLRTTWMRPDLRVITIQEFSSWLLNEPRPIKEALMDQEHLAGIGNIYSSEGCHLAGIDPHTPAKDLRPYQIPIILEALRCVVSHSIPKVQYQWLKVYRRDLCGSCDGPVVRTKLAARATFTCKRCQGEPQP